jgi:type II secretory pathway predicted ATPase ExeA
VLELELILLEDAHEGIRTVRVVLDDQDLDIWVFRGVQLALQSVLVGQAKLASARVHHTFDKFADRCAFVIEVVVKVAVKTVI